MHLRPILFVFCLALMVNRADAREARVQLPEGFAAEPEIHAVEGYSPRRFQQPLVFGPYSARIQAGGDTAVSGGSLGRLDLAEGERANAFLLTTRDQPVIDVECIGRASLLGQEDEDGGWEVDLGALAGPVLACGLRLSQDDPGRRLVLEARARAPSGWVDSPWGRLRVTPLLGYAGSRWRSDEPTGYAVAGESGTLMVVDLLNAGQVLFDPTLDARSKAWLAAVAAALLLSPGVEPG